MEDENSEPRIGESELAAEERLSAELETDEGTSDRGAEEYGSVDKLIGEAVEDEAPVVKLTVDFTVVVIELATGAESSEAELELLELELAERVG